MLTRDEIYAALEQLGKDLLSEKLTGELLLTGGAAMCLVHEARDMTKDVDALYEPKGVIDKLVSRIAEERNLPEDWLNDSVKGFFAKDFPVEQFKNFDGLKVTTVAPEYLLAMKLMSARQGEKDIEDIGFLLNKLKLMTSDEVYEVLTRYYPVNRILPKTMYVIEEFFWVALYVCSANNFFRLASNEI